MKKALLITVLALAFGAAANAQGLLDRFTDPEKGEVVFIKKGNYAIGISGAYRNIAVTGDDATKAGYAVITMLNLGTGGLQTWSVTPSVSWFVANDVSLGISLDYNGSILDTDIRLDLRDVFPSTTEGLNLILSNRDTRSHSFGASFVARKYLSFFGSKTFAVFGEARLSGSYGFKVSEPLSLKAANHARKTDNFGIAAKAGVGLAVKLRDGSAISLAIPLFGVGWNNSSQVKVNAVIKDGATAINPDDPSTYELITSHTRVNQFSATRNLDMLGVSFGYLRYIEPKKKH